MCVGVQEARWGRGGVTSKLQKKLIKNEKREGAEGGEGEAGDDGSRRGWMEGGEKEGEENRGEGMEGGRQCFIENGWTNSV